MSLRSHKTFELFCLLMEGSGFVQIIMGPDPDPRGPKTYGFQGSGSGTLLRHHQNQRLLWDFVKPNKDFNLAISTQSFFVGRATKCLVEKQHHENPGEVR